MGILNAFVGINCVIICQLYPDGGDIYGTVGGIQESHCRAGGSRESLSP
jgi:hypothetical protein